MTMASRMNRNHLSFGLNLLVAKRSRFDDAYFRIELLSIMPNQAVEFSVITLWLVLIFEPLLLKIVLNFGQQ
jgi:hypothetical protein